MASQFNSPFQTNNQKSRGITLDQSLQEIADFSNKGITKKIITCGSCNFKIDKLDAKFCPNCGVKLVRNNDNVINTVKGEINVSKLASNIKKFDQNKDTKGNDFFAQKNARKYKKPMIDLTK